MTPSQRALKGRKTLPGYLLPLSCIKGCKTIKNTGIMNTTATISFNSADMATRENWIDIALPYEDQLEECVSSIIEQCKLTGDEVMEGNGQIHKHTRNGYIILADSGETMYLPMECYKGENDEIGTRVCYGKTRSNGEKTMCVDAMECVSVSELKYRMFSSIEDCDMTMAATAAWAIYDKAPEPLRENMRAKFHSLRNEYKRFRRLFKQAEVTFSPCAA